MVFSQFFASEAVFEAREGAGFDIGCVVTCRPVQQGAHVGVLLDEAWQASGSQSRHVLPDQHLGIAVDTGAYVHCGDGDRCRDFLGNLGRHHLDEQGKGSGGFEGGIDQPLGSPRLWIR